MLINLTIEQAHTSGSYGTAKVSMQVTELPAIEWLFLALVFAYAGLELGTVI